MTESEALWRPSMLKIDPRTLSDQSVQMDRFDEADWGHVHKEIAKLRARTKELAAFAPTGAQLMPDTFASFIKARPMLKTVEEIRPTFLINRVVVGEMMDLDEWASLRLCTQGDDVASAFACCDLQPRLQELLDREQIRQSEMEHLEEMLVALAVMREANEDTELMETAVAMLGERLLNSLEGDAAEMKAEIAQAVKEAEQEARGLMLALNAWGRLAGGHLRLPIKERLRWAAKANTPRMRKIAEILGAMRNLVYTDRVLPDPNLPDELTEIQLGRDLSRVLPVELLKLRDPRRRQEFYRDFTEGRLRERRYEGEQTLGRGGIVLCEDGSGSMQGERELRAKGVMLMLMEIAKTQRRQFTLIHFGWETEIEIMRFHRPEDFTFDRIIEAGELFFCGGTDFQMPLSHAVEILETEHSAQGKVDGDIVFLTDGDCQVSAPFLANFHAAEERLGFKTIGISVAQPSPPTLMKICQGKVVSWDDLTNPAELRDVYKAVA